ncbi:MAG: SDR family NAD(P)-dependent oxidoreductase [Steroidobacteraceae bacterium]|nr:SDR family NAD(P)-dependent oxidoreductase [Steroidobacteraceae bacterium]
MNSPQTRPLAMVTGASSGIGYELARQFALHGYDLIIAADDAGELVGAADRLQQVDSAMRVKAVTVDLSVPEGVTTLYNTAAALKRPVDVLAANAGIGVWGDFARETSLEAELRLINLNVTSQVHLIKLVVADMVDRGSGKVLITSSIASLAPGPNYAAYAASKAFLRSFGQAIRQELEDSGVSVTVLMPGPTDTEFFERADMLESKAAQGPKQDPAEVAAEAFDALEKDKDHVVTGAKNKLQATASKLVPDKVGARLHGSQTRPEPRNPR